MSVNRIKKLDLLCGDPYFINEYIQIYQPTLREIKNYGENEYWSLAHSLTATSYDYRFQLDDIGIFYEDVEDFTIFCRVASSLTKEESEILFGKNIDFENDFEIMVKQLGDEQELVFRNIDMGYDIDKVIYELIVGYIRKLHGFKRNFKRAGNKTAMKFYMEDERKMLEMQAQQTKNEEDSSMFEPLISTLVNLPGFKYDYETVWDLKLYQFMDAVQRNLKIDSYRNLMTGVYTGNIDMKSIKKKEQLNLFGEL